VKEKGGETTEVVEEQIGQEKTAEEEQVVWQEGKSKEEQIENYTVKFDL